jgi:hypothetical protein
VLREGTSTLLDSRQQGGTAGHGRLVGGTLERWGDEGGGLTYAPRRFCEGRRRGGQQQTWLSSCAREGVRDSIDIDMGEKWDGGTAHCEGEAVAAR